jgi:hypothetical protein
MLSFSLFSVLFDRSIYIFFPMLLEHILFFSNDPSLFLQDYKERNLFYFGLFIFCGWMTCFA